MNKHRQFANPITIFFLTFPYGISSGFVSVTLPFILVQHGFSVAAAAAITAVGLSSNLWRFAWAPLTDLTLSLHKWYIIGIAMCAISLFSLVFVPLTVAYSRILMSVVFVSQVAATFVFAPVGGFMAKAIEEGKKDERQVMLKQAIWVEWALAAVRASGWPVICLLRHRVRLFL